MRKRKKAILIMISAVLLLTGCSLNFGARVYDDEKKIAKNYNTYNLVFSKQSVEGNSLSGSAGKMEGMGTIWKYSAAEDTDVNITYRIKIHSGKAKLVLISPDDTLTTLVECTPDSDAEQETSDTFHVEKGKNRIKLIGAKDTKIEFDISVDAGKISTFGS